MHLTHRLEFRRLVAGYALSTIGDAGVRMLLAWITLERRGTVAMSGVFIASAAACIFGPLIGRCLDRYHLRDILSAACLARFALMLALAFMNQDAIARYAALFAFLSAFFSLAHGPAVSKTIPAMFAVNEMHEANASSGVSFLISSAAGPALGGAILAHYGLHSACFAFAAIFFINIPLSRYITSPLFRAKDGEERPSSSYAEVFRSLANIPVVLSLVTLAVILNFSLAPINVALAPLMLSLGAGPQGFGFAMALLVVGAIGGNLAAGGRLLKTVSWDRSILASLGATALGLFAVGLSQSPLQAALSVLLIGAALPFFQVPVATQLQRSVPPGNAGQIFATINSVSLFSAPLAAAGAGLLLKRLTPIQLFFGAAATNVLLCVGWTILRRDAGAELSVDSVPLQ